VFLDSLNLKSTSFNDINWIILVAQKIL